MACAISGTVSGTTTAASASCLKYTKLIPKPNTKHSTLSIAAASFHLSIRATRRIREGLMATPIVKAEAATIEKSGIKTVRNPPESKLTQLGVRKWPKWGCPPSKFPWTYSAKETCYLLEGKVKVYPDGSDEAVEIGAGDLVEFPKGMSCTWDVSVGVDKHYNFE